MTVKLEIRSNIHAGDLVMLKVEPRFRLDRGCKGPYRVTPTNAAIQMMNDPSAEPLIVSLQRLSLCNGSFSSNTEPWRGHYKSQRRLNYNYLLEAVTALCWQGL